MTALEEIVEFAEHCIGLAQRERDRLADLRGRVAGERAGNDQDLLVGEHAREKERSCKRRHFAFRGRYGGVQAQSKDPHLCHASR